MHSSGYSNDVSASQAGLRGWTQRLRTPFTRQVIEGARYARAGDGNPLRLTFFVTSMRILCSRKNL